MAAFIGAGIVSVAAFSDVTAFDSLSFTDVGNVSKLVPTFSEERKTLKNYRNAAGGTVRADMDAASAQLLAAIAEELDAEELGSTCE